MTPLNYAIIKHFTTVDEASPLEVYEAIKGEYGNYRMCTPKAINVAVMTAEKNGLLEESRYELDANGELVIYYHAVGEGLDAINSFIK